MIELAVHAARAEAVEARVTAGSMEAVDSNGYPVLWAITWRARSASWLLRHRSLLIALLKMQRHWTFVLDHPGAALDHGRFPSAPIARLRVPLGEPLPVADGQVCQLRPCELGVRTGGNLARLSDQHWTRTGFQLRRHQPAQAPAPQRRRGGGRFGVSSGRGRRRGRGHQRRPQPGNPYSPSSRVERLVPLGAKHPGES